MPIESINPANGELIKRFEPLSGEAIRQKIALASDAFKSYASVPLSHRPLCMKKLANLLEEDALELAEMITQEMGKPIKASHAELAKCAAACRYYAENANRMLAPELIVTEAARSCVRWD